MPERRHQGVGDVGRFSGKEEQRLGGLDLGLLDFGARWYDPALCRWTSQDPLAAKYPGLSPYCYCGGDPVGRVDPDGRSWYFSLDEGTFLAYIDDEDDRVYMLTQEQIHDANGELLKYSDYRQMENSFGQMMLEEELTDTAIKNVYTEFYHRAMQSSEDDAEKSKSHVPIRVSEEKCVKCINGFSCPPLATSSINGGLIVYKHNPGHEWNGYDLINVLAHEYKHRIDVLNKRNISERAADVFSTKHWSYSKTSIGRKERIAQHIKEN